MAYYLNWEKLGNSERCVMLCTDKEGTCVGWFNVLMTEFIVVCGHRDGVYLVLICRHVVIFVARFE